MSDAATGEATVSDAAMGEATVRDAAVGEATVLDAPVTAARPSRRTRAWWADTVPVPTPRAAALVLVIGILAVVGLPRPALAAALGVLVLAMVLDLRLAPHGGAIGLRRSLPSQVTLGEPAVVTWTLQNPGSRAIEVVLADSFPPSLGASSRRVVRLLSTYTQVEVSTELRPWRRGTVELDRVTIRVVGPLGLASRQRDRSLPGRIEVHPRFPSRRVAELRLQQARQLSAGLRSVRARGAGTEFDTLRDYVQGDDVRHLDWVATGRAGHPVVRTFQAERNQSVLVLLDTGRVVAGLVDGVPRLDHAMDATLALATVAAGLGDRVGMVAFGSRVRAMVAARADGNQRARLSRAMHRLEPELAESGYREAFATTLARFRRRALVVLLTDLSDGAVQESLVPALPTLTQAHEVVIASVQDPTVTALQRQRPSEPTQVFVAAAAARILDQRAHAASRLRGLGAHSVEAPPSQLGVRLVEQYLDVKSRGQL